MFNASRFDGARTGTKSTSGSYQTASVNPKGYNTTTGYSNYSRNSDGYEHDVKGNTSSSGKGTAGLEGTKGNYGIG